MHPSKTFAESDICSKYADVKQALENYAKFNAEGKGNFSQYIYNIVLYLCSSSASNSLTPPENGTGRRGEYYCPFSPFYAIITVFSINIELVMETML